MSDLNLDIHTFQGPAEGKTLTILGAVHGNEHCGTEAINKVMDLISAGDIVIKAGTLTMIPICNPRAYKQKVRFTQRNLNRFMYPKDSPQAYEDNLDNIICPVLDKTDYLVDIHSYSSQGESFIFLSQLDQDNIAFASSLESPRFIYGWGEAMTNNDELTDKRQAMGTTEYAREQGAIAVTLECGNHDNANNADVAFNAILGALQHCGLADIDPALKATTTNTSDQYSIRMRGAQLKAKEGKFANNWTNMHKVTKGTLVASYDDGEDITMSESGYIVLPMYDPTIGDQWFFWGVEDPLDA